MILSYYGGIKRSPIALNHRPAPSITAYSASAATETIERMASKSTIFDLALILWSIRPVVTLFHTNNTVICIFYRIITTEPKSFALLIED